MKNTAIVRLSLELHIETDFDLRTLVNKLHPSTVVNLKVAEILSADGSVHNSENATLLESEIIEFEDNSEE
ncbi:hypothetical protein AF332_11690 [Sporosarcina globispora]|uniref:Uncharacterized protein n=1 Tax=Sporosarcina globispora TaxID=1459 RepID=A0A0M0GD13_SPOGL|nr:hypothetical protein [Sporosarcina globispora]KON87422.1 hypothetical protein AF332_11690 [Sporosarcina globispora]